jgi:serine/threonine protein kinase HipA of HipAB toxin-antitoxin module
MNWRYLPGCPARLVFNIVVSNDDDHLRNHAFGVGAPSAAEKLTGRPGPTS